MVRRSVVTSGMLDQLLSLAFDSVSSKVNDSIDIRENWLVTYSIIRTVISNVREMIL